MCSRKARENNCWEQVTEKCCPQEKYKRNIFFPFTTKETIRNHITRELGLDRKGIRAHSHMPAHSILKPTMWYVTCVVLSCTQDIEGEGASLALVGHLFSDGVTRCFTLTSFAPHIVLLGWWKLNLALLLNQLRLA